MNNAFVKILCISSALLAYGCDNPENKDKEAPINGEVSTTNMKEIGGSTEQNTHYAVGKVVSVDNDNREILVDLEPIPTLQWPAETKSFHVPGKENLNNLQTGEVIELYFTEKEPGDYVAHNLRER